MDDKMKELVETMEERFSAKMEKKMEEILKRKDGEKEETTQKRDAAQNE